jgi:hypothetical protein
MADFRMSRLFFLLLSRLPVGESRREESWEARLAE